ncbi:Chromosome partition protein smc [Thioalkalivibrio nitratireducens DSM 14787]|uniref:Chromosome partition protein Smc n=1 Tax=Thioalkalivibrio nitratireducens (strain DSM 14787 / UNIQEM 213 / ALEN2) TaxID=1255043 RepID=L0DU19_THIND|nr:chromosome segregation protein SMC [Thioalkalivibrio nitratireducens]AGA33089.1 Chromosome partition protein smc [Thioalkalivibrio nitratireducens DSM 14787]
MRLARIKLAGFKSFVDPTTLMLPGNRVGIVGPNGCGKSNTIDAVRWVMGESSAKHLRGDSSEDVIFNGSASRKPVGQASIELFFDNSEGRLGGEYSSFAEISVRRALSRDGQSKYYLNGQRARKRDVTDLFLGTGLGPRSYAIIEQGMISRLIEARPEELRVYLEEAAGISKYKERRRETENRIRHTRENLERLDDVREEVERQAGKLTRQAEIAEKYQELAAQRRQRRAELLLLRLKALEQRMETERLQLVEAETALTGLRAHVQQKETETEGLRVRRAELEQAQQAAQAGFYDVSADVSRLEQSIRHAEAELEREAREQVQLEARVQESARAEEAARSRVQEAEAAIEVHDLECETAVAAQELAEQASETAEEAMHAAREERSQWHRAMAEPQQAAQLARTRMDHADQLLQRARQRRERLREEQGRLLSTEGSADLKQAERELAVAAQGYEQLQERRAALRDTLSERRSELQEEQERSHGAERRAREIAGQLASLKILPGLDRDEDREAFARWAREHGIDPGRRVAAQIEVDPGWEAAVEVVLGQWFEAVLASLDELPPALPDAAFRALDPAVDAASFPADSLAARVRAPDALRALLAAVQCAETLDEAWARLDAGGSPGMSVVTPHGSWIGPGWLCHRTVDRQVEGVIERLRLERSLEQEAAELWAQGEAFSARLDELRDVIRGVEGDLEQTESGLRESQREVSRLEAQVQRLRERAQQADERRRRLDQEIAELEEEIERASVQRDEALAERNEALSRLEGLDRDRERLEQQVAEAERRQREARNDAQQARDRASAMRLAVQEARHRVALEQGQVERLEQQRAQDRERLVQLQEARTGRLAPLDGWRNDLQQRLAQRQESEQALATARAALDACDADLRQLAADLRELGGQVEQGRAGCEERRLHLRELGVQQDQLAGQFGESGFEPEALGADLPEDAAIPAWEEAVAILDRKIERLGPINLAAIEEARSLAERSRYLREQHDDLITALETLESAMQKIDRETRALFRQTYDQVNEGLGQKFRRLFGGGEARLELTGDDLLDTGVAIMARPPGKRLSTIHLMSGGEKALTAAALVFAIFELNPAPFCMLDEVDAPLDEANVGRFCALLQDMSERIQFIFITHNKTTMAMAEQLIGVTMHEPGVSRLVSVDIDAAVELAEA